MTKQKGKARETAPGSSMLDPSGQDVWERRFGERYVHVPQQPFMPNRRERRQSEQAQKLTNQGRRKDLVSCGMRRP